MAEILRRAIARRAPIESLPGELAERVVQNLTSVHDVISVAGSSASGRAAAKTHVL
jgi:hypothetical protein